ncbi:MAG TPA: hydroxymethylglutaryl-CoA synthase [Erysipelothrix sp.]|nr:hydroxymethylglutaryl-CoA synthase [Erysipelothrix sp.]
MNIGIDKISFYTPNQYIDMVDLANYRGIDPNKFTIGLGQDEMAIPFPSQDPITMAANAADKILTPNDKDTIDLVLFATETGTDYSKAGSVYVRHLLDIQPFARCIELKEACYSGTAAIQLAKSHVAQNPDKKALILMSDISRYGLDTPGEPTQGAGAVALVISKDPNILIIEDESSYFTDDVMDFWRPNYSDVAFVDGKYSNEQYQRFFDKTYNNYLEKTNRTLEDFKAITFHIPYTKIGLKAIQSITEDENRLEIYRKSTTYNRRSGNVYTGSLYLSLISLLDSHVLNANDRIGLYSYGSGSVAEFFSMSVVEGYKEHLYKHHQEDLDNRHQIDIPTYEKMYKIKYPEDGSRVEFDYENDKGPFVLSHIEDHIRHYIKR